MAKVSASKRPAQYTIVLTLSEDEAQSLLEFNLAQIDAEEFEVNGETWYPDSSNTAVVEALENAGVRVASSLPSGS